MHGHGMHSHGLGILEKCCCPLYSAEVGKENYSIIHSSKFRSVLDPPFESLNHNMWCWRNSYVRQLENIPQDLATHRRTNNQLNDCVDWFVYHKHLEDVATCCLILVSVLEFKASLLPSWEGCRVQTRWAVVTRDKDAVCMFISCIRIHFAYYARTRCRAWMVVSRQEQLLTGSGACFCLEGCGISPRNLSRTTSRAIFKGKHCPNLVDVNLH